MSNFYRFEFVHGPYDGLVVEDSAMIAPRVRLPVGSAPSFAPPGEPAPVYQLQSRSLEWEEGSPQAVLRYEFQGNLTEAAAAGRLSLGTRLKRWLSTRNGRLSNWMLTEINYPMSTRDIR